MSVSNIGSFSRFLARRTFFVAIFSLLLLGCAGSGATYEEQSSALPPLSAGKGRMVFFGTNWAWYGLLAGVVWLPEITIDGVVEPTPHGISIFFVVDRAPGVYRIAVKGQSNPSYAVTVQEGSVNFIEMHKSQVRERNILPLRVFKHILTFSKVIPNYANQEIRNMSFKNSPSSS